MENIRVLICAAMLLSLIGIPSDSRGQDTARQAQGMWSSLNALPPGEELTMRLKNGRKVKGRMSYVSETGLTLTHGNKTVETDRDRVSKIYRLVPKSRKMHAALGFLAGFGGFIAVHAALAPDELGGHDALGGLLFGGAGAWVGHIVGGRSKKRVLIYDAEVLTSLSRPSPHKKAPVSPKIITAQLADLPNPGSDGSRESSPYPPKGEKSQEKEGI